MQPVAVEPVVISIAGVDPSAGAGLLADMEVLRTHGARGVGVVTLLTVQSSVGVARVEYVEAELVREQLVALLEDLPVAAVKTGALGTAAVVRVVAEVLRGRGLPLFVDPVARSSSGAELLASDAVEVLRGELLPLTTVFTPNLSEAALFSGLGELGSPEPMEAAARRLRALGPAAVWVKGGHLRGAPVDVWLDGEGARRFTRERIETRHDHGTGCALASALAAGVARGLSLREAAARAHAWLGRALARAPGLGRGAGPLELRAAPDEGDSG